MKRRLVFQLVQRTSLLDPAAAEAIMCHTYGHPVEYTCDPAEIISCCVCHPVSDKGGEKCCCCDTGCYEDSSYRNTVSTQLGKESRSVSSLAICCSVLDALYIEELPQESTEVRITAFIRDAAAANPALWKMMVNGDAATLSSAASNSVGSVNGISVPTTKIVPR